MLRFTEPVVIMVLATKEFVMALYVRSIIAEVPQIIPQGIHGEDAKLINDQKKKHQFYRHFLLSVLAITNKFYPFIIY